MSTAAFSVPSDSRRRISVTRRGQTTAASTSAAADEAIRRIIDDRRSRSRHGPMQLRRESAISGAIGRLTDTINESMASGRLLRQVPKVLVVVAVAMVLATATSSVITRGRQLHGITGTVRFGDAPLANGMLEFHLKTPSTDGKAFSTVIHTDAQGAFRRSAAGGLPRGAYAVVVKTRHPAAGTARRLPAVVIPPHYTASTSTPLSVEVNGSHASLDLVIRK